MVFSLLIGIPSGILAAVRVGRFWDSAGKVFALLGLSLPSFWVGLVLILVFSVYLRWLPSSGMGTPLHLIGHRNAGNTEQRRGKVYVLHQGAATAACLDGFGIAHQQRRAERFLVHVNVEASTVICKSAKWCSRRGDVTDRGVKCRTS